jgi:hypothetical protein
MPTNFAFVDMNTFTLPKRLYMIVLHLSAALAADFPEPSFDWLMKIADWATELFYYILSCAKAINPRGIMLVISHHFLEKMGA